MTLIGMTQCGVFTTRAAITLSTMGETLFAHRAITHHARRQLRFARAAVDSFAIHTLRRETIAADQMIVGAQKEFS